ncbi:activated Cdc42 kinase-like isoform X3 [Plutella xylostella]|uniref:activated Cdc42 kinase-like isoform X3 n=1 Tax=Plutella xylostella TaxID=51655 RepID=UPI002032A21E|nr:activated Cdc42 kinase-like isoform X3 [Plutella xylostella]
MEGSFEDQILLEFLEEAELQQYHKLFRESLKVSKLSQLKYVFSEDLAQIGLSKPEQRRFKKIYSKYFPNQYISRIKNLFLPNRRHELHNHGPSSLPTDLHLLSESTVHVPSKHIIPKDDITINKELGMGQFGVVQQGTWTTGNQRIQVAIKCLGHERMTSDSTEFLKEAAVMHGIEHPFIVRLYGVVLDVESLMLVTELAPLRSLLECLREVSLRPHFPVPTLCEFAEQICSGMTYLEQKRLIHRDLAARNILVFNKDRVKISDFGLSRALGVGKDYYQTNYNVNLKLPVAWCAPECILYLRFTTSSDVWAYGVCLWEMFTYGFQPWVALTGQQILEAIDSPNCQRLERPELCPEQYYIVMLHCWEHDPTHRPKFSQLLVKLQSIRPEQVQATQNFHKPDENRLRVSYLEYKTGQTITVLGKNHNNTSLWYGVLAGGACGLFDPACTKPVVPKGAAKPPRQVVPPYQPCKELDQQPLINPHSPSFLTGAVSMPPYPLLDAEATADVSASASTSAAEMCSKSSRKNGKENIVSSGKGILNKVKAGIFKSHDSASHNIEPEHEYSEIGETDNKGGTEFSQILLQEMESIIKKTNTMSRYYHYSDSNNWEAPDFFDDFGRGKAHTMSASEKKRGFHSGTMKPMSAHDTKTLDTAVALANKITTRSMNDLEPGKWGTEEDNNILKELTKKDKEAPKEEQDDKPCRNFSEQARSVPDIQETITEESKAAYTTFIEQPSLVSSLIPQLAATQPLTGGSSEDLGRDGRRSLRCNISHPPHRYPEKPIATVEIDYHHEYYNEPRSSTSNDNELALPPRTSKPKLVDKPRHVRKHPLLTQPSRPDAKKPIPKNNNIYQNCHMQAREKAQYQNLGDEGVDVFDGVVKDTNPFKSHANPFESFMPDPQPSTSGTAFYEEGSLVKGRKSSADFPHGMSRSPGAMQLAGPLGYQGGASAAYCWGSPQRLRQGTYGTPVGRDASYASRYAPLDGGSMFGYTAEMKYVNVPVDGSVNGQAKHPRLLKDPAVRKCSDVYSSKYKFRLLPDPSVERETGFFSLSPLGGAVNSQSQRISKSPQPSVVRDFSCASPDGTVSRPKSQPLDTDVYVTMYKFRPLPDPPVERSTSVVSYRRPRGGAVGSQSQRHSRSALVRDSARASLDGSVRRSRSQPLDTDIYTAMYKFRPLPDPPVERNTGVSRRGGHVVTKPVVDGALQLAPHGSPGIYMNMSKFRSNPNPPIGRDKSPVDVAANVSQSQPSSRRSGGKHACRGCATYKPLKLSNDYIELKP